eukprot:Phypoly_transcript_12877.p1 GENE.Phypoly_transcript_12877~~Phypoly_transcript_12877.p1  ORF type:complete len:189 (+),score=10.15 Phypoly_transcript_12877:246-812(+)
MMKVCLVLIALIAAVNCGELVPRSDVSCDLCLQVMDGGLDILLNEILNGGVIGGCDNLCHFMPDTLELGCNHLCDFVGIKEFVKVINHTDPDPIWYCQELHACPKVDGGSVIDSTTIVVPDFGVLGADFMVLSTYIVQNATGPGLLTITLTPPNGEELIGVHNIPLPLHFIHKSGTYKGKFSTKNLKY